MHKYNYYLCISIYYVHRSFKTNIIVKAIKHNYN